MSKDIIQLLKNKDDKGMALLYSQYSPSLYGLAVRSLKNENDAEEALQSALLKIWKNIDTYDESKSSLFTWMYQIMRNTCIDMKRLKSYKNQSMTSSIDASATYDVVSRDADVTLGHDVTKLLSTLDDKYSFVLDYIYLRGYTQAELADEFDIPIGTIKTRVKKGIDELRAKLVSEKKFFLSIFFILSILLILKCIIA